MRVLIGLLLLVPLAAARAAEPGSDTAVCEAAITATGRGGLVPGSLLSAIAHTESGRVLPDGRAVPWPWTINAAGAGHHYDSALEAVAAVEAFRAKGVQSIDVGCMQVNLTHHPRAFATLQQAFDPTANVAYATRFLAGLRAELGDWPRAVAAYHSRTPALGAKYSQRVLGGGLGGGEVIAERPRPPAIDSFGVYTPAFARQLAQDAAARNARDRLLAPRLTSRSQLASSVGALGVTSSGLYAPRLASQLRPPGPMLTDGQVGLAQADLGGRLLGVRR